MRALRASLICGALALSLAATDVANGRDAQWRYLMPVDHGIRADRGGKGHFLAPRNHGKHNGIDLLAPVGTPVLAACHGKARSGTRGGFGHYVHLVCRLETELTGGRETYASLFHAHLQHKAVPHDRWTTVTAGRQLGTVGKSGNAIGPSIMPHVHLELIVHDSEAAAMKERHSGRNQSDNAASLALRATIAEHCTQPLAFNSRHAVHRARRFDPYMVLTCLQVKKPTFSTPKAPLTKWARRWSTHYVANGFDVDVGINRRR